MGCFPACFTCSTSKRRKRHNSDQGLKTTEALQPIEPANRENNVGELIKLIRESKDDVEEQVSCTAKKRVTFDLNVKSYEESSAKDIVCDLVEGKKEKKSGNEEVLPKEIEPLLDTMALSKVASFTPNNRYQDCRKSTDECEDMGLEDVDLEEEEEEEDDDGSDADDKGVVLQEESSESLFSLSLDSRKQVCDAEKGEKEVNSPLPIRSFSEEEVKLKASGSCRNAGKRGLFGHSVLNPIENFAEWKEVKERPISPFLRDQEKENVSLEQDVSVLPSPEPSLKLANRSSKPNSSEMKHATEQEIGVDTSLSSWLVGSESTFKSNPSANRSVENLKSEKERELERVSASSSPARSRSQSRHATPKIGTVGSYWAHTGQNMDSASSSSGKRISVTERKNRKDQTVSCNSTPFEARLGRALDTSVC